MPTIIHARPSIDWPPDTEQAKLHPYHQELEIHALYEVNHYRMDRGMPSISFLPRGARGSSLKCPIAQATGMIATYNKVYRKVGPNAAKLLGAFDRGNLPHLERK